MDGKWIDLSQPFYEGMPFPKIFGPPSIGEAVHVIETTPKIEIRFTRYQLTTHIGTHVDAARHFFSEGKTIDQYPFERFVGEGVVLDVRRDKPVQLTAKELKESSPQIKKDDIVLLYTGWAEKYFYDDESYFTHPYLSEDAANWLVEIGINIIGMDTTTLDMPIPLRPEGFNFPVHRTLLGNDILIIENLGPKLAQLLGRRLIIGAFPIKIRGVDAAPSAVFAVLKE